MQKVQSLYGQQRDWQDKVKLIQLKSTNKESTTTKLLLNKNLQLERDKHLEKDVIGTWNSSNRYENLRDGLEKKRGTPVSFAKDLVDRYSVIKRPWWYEFQALRDITISQI